jgi:nucleoid DNA-binding protein
MSEESGLENNQNEPNKPIKPRGKTGRPPLSSTRIGKVQLVKMMANESGYTYIVARDLYEAFEKVIQKCIVNEITVYLPEFLELYVQTIPPRIQFFNFEQRYRPTGESKRIVFKSVRNFNQLSGIKRNKHDYDDLIIPSDKEE